MFLLGTMWPFQPQLQCDPVVGRLQTRAGGQVNGRPAGSTRRKPGWRGWGATHQRTDSGGENGIPVARAVRGVAGRRAAAPGRPAPACGARPAGHARGHRGVDGPDRRGDLGRRPPALGRPDGPLLRVAAAVDPGVGGRSGPADPPRARLPARPRPDVRRRRPLRGPGRRRSGRPRRGRSGAGRGRPAACPRAVAGGGPGRLRLRALRHGRVPASRGAPPRGRGAADRRRPAARPAHPADRRARGAGGGPSAAGALLGPADGGLLPVGTAVRRPGRLLADPGDPDRGARHRAGRRAETARAPGARAVDRPDPARCDPRGAPFGSAATAARHAGRPAGPAAGAPAHPSGHRGHRPRRADHPPGPGGGPRRGR